MNECPQIEDHEGSEAGIRVVPRVIARPFWDGLFLCHYFRKEPLGRFLENLVNKQERKKSDERKIAEHQRGGIKGH